MGLHAGEGEKSADKWAALRVRISGYVMKLVPFTRPRQGLFAKRRKRTYARVLPDEHWDLIRRQAPGNLLQLTRSDSRKLPAGTVVKFVRPLRSSYRVLVEDGRGDERLVPIEWLAPVGSEESSLEHEAGEP